MKAYIGIDPGKAGGISIIANGHPTYSVKMPETERDIWDTVHDLRKWMDLEVIAAIESVHSMPGQGVSSVFTFGRGYGGLRMALIASGIPFIEVTPQRWQKDMHCRTGGDKNVTKRLAQQLFPGVRVTHHNADSLIIAKWLSERP